MNTRDQQLELVSSTEGPLTIAEDLAAFGIVKDRPIDTAAARLHSWALAASSGVNMLRVGGVLYSWHPQEKRKNGAVKGRVYAQPRGQLSHDAGGFEIAADGTVLRIPAALAGALPGADRATPATEEPAP